MLVVLALGACSGDDGTPGTDGTAPEPTGSTGDTSASTTDTAPTGEPWLARNHEGSLVVRREIPLSGNSNKYDILGLFVDDLQGATTGLWCRNQGVCLEGLPDEDPVSLQATAFRQGLARYDWVGERITIGQDPRQWIDVPFVPDVLANFGVYQRLNVSFDEDEIMPYRVEFGGAWGEVELDDFLDVPLMPRIELVNTAVAYNSPAVEFLWEFPPEEAVPKGPGRMFLRVASNQVDELIPLRDNGSYTLDLSAYDLNPSSNVDVFLGRWIDERVELSGGNVMNVYSIAEVKVTTPRCAVDLSFPTPARFPAESGVVVEAHAMSMGYRGVVHSSEVHDYREDTTGLGFDNVSAELRFQLQDTDGSVCELRYDASQATPREPFPSANGALVQQAFELRPNPNTLYQHCYGPALSVEATSGSPVVVKVQPGAADNGTAMLNQLSVATREVPAAPAGSARIDLVVVGLQGVTVIQGEETTGAPTPPSPKSSDVVLASYQVSGDTVSELEDERQFTHRMPEGFPDDSARSFIEPQTWAFGFGEALDERNQVDGGSDRVWGFFAMEPEAPAGVEIGAGLATHLSDCSTVDPDLRPARYTSGSPITSALYEMQGTMWLPLEAPVDTGSTGGTGTTADTGSTTTP